MTQFVANGPDIPEALLEAHEDGRVVFFCGAGISYPAGLPGFAGLVDRIYEELGTKPDLIEEEALKRSQFDAALDLLERRIPGQRLAVRKALKRALRPRLRRKGATNTHSALLSLAECKDASLRLVTTNFDRIFDIVARREKISLTCFAAPLLPIPKNSRWSGLVYLHGCLPEDDSEADLNRLVVTSGDFGLAYLTERWASRFVGDLFRNYVVCFVGYSINDPVLRYMMDALAADRMLGEDTPQAYAFGDYEVGQEDSKTREWTAKGVIPILYSVPAGTHDHSALHNTISSWADTHRDGILGKERIVSEHAIAKPSTSTAQDNFVGRVLWAISDKSGLAAKRFADFNPAPSLDWLEAFAEERYTHADLSRFAVPPMPTADPTLRFSLVSRPCPYNLAPRMTLTRGASGAEWDSVMLQIGRWLLRHLNDPALLIWVAERGARLHSRLADLVERQLDHLDELKSSGKSSDLRDLAANAPNAVPGPSMTILWRLLLASRMKSGWSDLEIFTWRQRLKHGGLTNTLRRELRAALSPKLQIRRAFRFDRKEEDDLSDDAPPNRLVDWELVLSAKYVDSEYKNLKEDYQWQEALLTLLPDLEFLLTDALELQRELGTADEIDDRSHWDLPSIEPHWQNRNYQEWVVLIEMVRDAWTALMDHDPERAGRVASLWFEKPFPTFKRLAFYAASQRGVAPAVWVLWLTRADAWWLWSLNTQREVMRLLVTCSDDLSPELVAELEEAIVRGPPRSMFRDDLEDAKWSEYSHEMIWRRLAKLKRARGMLGPLGAKTLHSLSELYPFLALSKDDRDEFSHWMSGTGDPDFESRVERQSAPRSLPALVAWLGEAPPDRFFYEDDWEELCRTEFRLALAALYSLSKAGSWPEERWRQALQTWGHEDLVRLSWKYVPRLLLRMPQRSFAQCAHAIAWWLELVSKNEPSRMDLLVRLATRILDDAEEDDLDEDDDAVSRAINNPVGIATQALLNIWFARSPNDGDGLPDDLRPAFTSLCDLTKPKLRHGRVQLASRLISLYRVDKSWTEANLVPLLSWTADAAEARRMWQGFLWSPRIYPPLLAAFKQSFLDSAAHYLALGSMGRQYATFLTYAALNQVEGYRPRDFEVAVGRLPREGLAEVAQALSQGLQAAGEKREHFWENRILPFWRQIWPKSRDLASPEISEALALMCTWAGSQFPAALETVLDWISSPEYPHYLLHRFVEAGLASLYPEAALTFLDRVLTDQRWPGSEVRTCLDAILAAMPSLAHDARFRRLDEYARRHGQ